MASSSNRKGSAERPIPHTRIEDDTMIRDNYIVGSKIGQGSFGKVYEATHRTTGVKWAIKSINKEKAGSLALKLVEREVMILKRVSHPNIIILNEVMESPKKMYLVMELCTGGELADILKIRYFSEAETKIIMGRLASGIAYLHKNGIVHRDLKLENILLAVNPDNPSDKLHVKITDFGLSVVKGGVTPDSMMQDFCGTPMYMAPEILDNKSYSQQCDVWALGVIMYTLLCGYPPFTAKEEAVLYDLIREADVKFDNEIWSTVSEEGKNCIQGMLKLDPAHRLSAAEVLNHHWITGETRDTTQPSNVLEMMKMWKDELMNDEANQDGEHSKDVSDVQQGTMVPQKGVAVDKSEPSHSRSQPDSGTQVKVSERSKGSFKGARSSTGQTSTPNTLPRSSIPQRPSITMVPRNSSLVGSTQPRPLPSSNGTSKGSSVVKPAGNKQVKKQK